MKFSDYQEFVDSVAIYRHPPDQQPKTIQEATAYIRVLTQKKFYPFMKLYGEIGETYEKFFRMVSQDETSERTAEKYQEERAELIKEFGDICWYLTAIAGDFNLKLSDLLPVNDAGDYVLPVLNWQPGNESVRMMHLIVLTSRLYEYLGKSIRDHYTPSKNVVGGTIIQAFDTISILAQHFLGSSINEILETNQNKLVDRKNRGVLQGSGDNR